MAIRSVPRPPKTGDVFKVPLTEGKHSYGQVVAEGLVGLFDICTSDEMPASEILAAPVLTREQGWGNVYDGQWPVVASAPLHEALRSPMSFWMRDAVSSEIHITTFIPDRPCSHRIGAEEETVGMRYDSLPLLHHLQEKLCVHFGLPVPPREGAAPRSSHSAGPFENEQAMDWLDSIPPERAVQDAVSEALETAIQMDESYIDADAGREAVAAAALLALKGRAYRIAHVPAPVADKRWAWRRVKDKGQLTERALLALDAVRGERSELASLWDPSRTGSSPWHEEVARIEAALRGSRKPGGVRAAK